MPTFLEQLVNEVMQKHSSELKDICVVFPTRRAGLFFKKELSAKITKPIWSPAVFSIQDFVLQLSGKNIPDNLTLIFELYESYKEFFPSDDFARFYPWGDLMLKDFDDIDKYMIHADKVFSTVTDLHKIDEDFALAEEDLERLRIFWKNFFDRDPSLLRNEFLNTWKHLQSIYYSFRKKLESKNLAYEGMAYRKLAEDLGNAAFKINHNYSHTIFAGFYALSPAEKTILKYFLDSGKASAYWDADSYYADDTTQEAGRFFRNNTLIEPGFLWKQDHFKNIKKEIEFISVPLLVGQAKYAGNILNALMKENNFISEKTAVVLPDEVLLFPMLYSLPEDLKDVNVTMGYPLRQTPLYNLFESLMTLQKNSRKSKAGEESYFFRDILNVINHPYIRLIADKPIRDWLAKLNQNFIRMPGSVLMHVDGPEIFKNIFVRIEKPGDAFSWFKKILRLILEAMREQDFRFHRLESEFVYNFYTNLSRLEDALKDNPVVDNIDTLWKIYREIISTVTIPFTGEPLKGLQLMGFLETRVLDFDNIIILSVNEDVLPAKGNSPSFIPFNIRKAFGLPTFEEQHAVSAYHFYRLLQRAGRIYLLHNSETSGLTTGEPSRFMLQLEHEMKKRFSDSISIVQKTISTKAVKEEIQPIVVGKSETVMKVLSQFVSDGSVDPSKKFSASGLISYIACPLRFYFQYIAGLREIEEPEENMEAATFGKVLHHAMQLIYKDVILLDKEVIAGLKKRIDDCVDQAIEKEFISLEQLEGKNVLFRNIIHELINRILDTELIHAPVKILQLEKDVSNLFPFSENNFVKLFGIIDRVDEKDGVVRIIDYKTGKVSKKKQDSIADLFTDPAHKEAFQATYYAYLSDRLISGREIKSGLLYVKELGDGIHFLNKGASFTAEQFKEFEISLSNLFKEIFSPETPFIQTKDEKLCKYCAFKTICNK